MSIAATHPAHTSHRRLAVRKFAVHAVEMSAAMVVGMFALAPLWGDVNDRPALHTIAMATNMTIGMTAWMVYWRHSRAAIIEMAGAMYIPFLALLIPYGLGLIGAGGLMGIGHTLMGFAMLGAMLWRREEYTGGHHAR